MDRPLIDGEFVTVLVEGIEPVQALTIPRSAILSDQQGSYVYVVNAKNVAEQRRVTLGQSTPTTAVIASGLQEGEKVIVDGVQRARPGQPVTPGPANPATPGMAKAAAANAPATGAGGNGPATAASRSPANPTPSGTPAASSGGGSAQH